MYRTGASDGKARLRRTSGAATLRRVKEREPCTRTGLSYPEDRGDAMGKPYLRPAVNAVDAGTGHVRDPDSPD